VAEVMNVEDELRCTTASTRPANSRYSLAGKPNRGAAWLPVIEMAFGPAMNLFGGPMVMIVDLSAEFGRL
jgi:hypothetical protein